MTTTLDTLASLRRDLQQFCRLREASIWSFYDGDTGGFRLTLDDCASTGTTIQEIGVPPKGVRHLTTTLTCFEALAEGPLTDSQLSALETPEAAPHLDLTHDAGQLTTLPEVVRRRAVLRRYVDAALKHPSDWYSDGAAYVYCRVRALGALSRLLEPSDTVLIDKP